MKRLIVWMGVLGISAGASGCLGGGDRSAELERGEQLFAEAGCGDCHTLGAAGATGEVGPDLDASSLDVRNVAEQVTGGGPGMPAFADRLSDDEILAIAEYVSDASAGSGGPVTEPFEPDDTQLSECHGAPDQPCYEQAFSNLVYEDGPGPALALLEQRLRTDRAVASGCHRMAHAMGSAALARFDNNVGKAFAEGSAVCSSGYYHGILEHSFAGTDEEELDGKVASLCEGETLESDPFLAFQCRHGLGHGLMIHTGYDLPQSLDTCDALGEQATTCYDGVFMENFNTSYDVSSEWVKDDDLMYPCNAVEENRKHSCYYIVTSRVLPEVGWSWRKAAEACRSAEPDWQYVCFRSFGRDAISTNSYNQQTARRLCRLTKEWEGECVLSVALHIANEENRLDGAGRFCRETQASLRLRCWAGVGSTAALIYPDERQRSVACQRETPDRLEQSACVTGRVPQ